MHQAAESLTRPSGVGHCGIASSASVANASACPVETMGLVKKLPALRLSGFAAVEADGARLVLISMPRDPGLRAAPTSHSPSTLSR